MQSSPPPRRVQVINDRAKLAKRIAELEAVVGRADEPMRLRAYVVVGRRDEAEMRPSSRAVH
jgi:hypothetical protein